MKKVVLLAFLFFAGLLAQAQVTTLSVDFSTGCPANTTTLADWITHNTIDTTNPLGAWTCTATEGRYGTPGMECTGYFHGMFHTDTSYLITPLLNLSGYTNVYLRFDTKTTIFTDGSKLDFVHLQSDTAIVADTSFVQNLSSALVPNITVGDSSDWVTHEINITGYKSISPLYFAFRYTSIPAYGSVWYLDNINVSATSGIQDKFIETLPMFIVGNSTPDKITLSLSSRTTTEYTLGIFDMLGRQVYGQTLNASAGIAEYHLSGFDLLPGMYFIKVGNGSTFGVAKTIVP